MTSLVAWLVRAQPREVAYSSSWLGIPKLCLFLAPGAVTHILAAVLGYWVLNKFNWPASTEPAFLRGLAMGVFGTAVVRVDFTKLPSVGGGISILNQVLAQFQGFQDIAIEKTIQKHVRGADDTKLYLLASAVVRHIEDDEFVKPETTAIMYEGIAKSIADIKAAGSNEEEKFSLQRTTEKTITKYLICKSDLP